MKKEISKYGICFLTTMPVYKQVSVKPELVSELLFGESFLALFEEDNWIYISMCLDKFEGWIDKRQFHEVTELEFNRCNASYRISLSPLEAISSNDFKRFISMGSTLPNFDGLSFKIDNTHFNYSGDVVPNLTDIDQSLLVDNIAKKLLFIPERKGGRSILGMDNDGFIQFVYKLFGVNLPRKSPHQARTGKVVHFAHEAKVGDVAYFVNPINRRVIHSGIIIQNAKIIHVEGFVRMDDFDHIGIYNQELKKYTYQLKIIRRYLK